MGAFSLKHYFIEGGLSTTCFAPEKSLFWISGLLKALIVTCQLPGSIANSNDSDLFIIIVHF